MAADSTPQTIGLDRFFDSREERAEVISSIQTKQDEIERREIRERYRQFQDELSEQILEVVNPNNEEDLLFEKLQTVDRLFKPVKNTREAALDSTSLVNISELGKKKAQALKTDFLRFNAADFCDKVRIKVSNGISKKENYGLSHDDWVKLGRTITPFFRSTPVLNFMCGAFQRDVVPKKKRTVKEKETESESSKVTKPAQLSSFEETERGELTTAQVEHLLKTLWGVYERNEKQPICFFEFVTNPNSYGQTVENIFYASFLVRDGHAFVSLDDEELPVIEPLQKDLNDATSSAQQQAGQKQQIVMTLTPAEWRDIVKSFKIEVPLIQPMKQQPTVLKENNHSNNSARQNSNALYEGYRCAQCAHGLAGFSFLENVNVQKLLFLMSVMSYFLLCTDITARLKLYKCKMVQSQRRVVGRSVK
ncbi:hypothetical protein RRG08_040719 [Elysia crispata]|uniref:Non-structural maintenance of chromosomes element 4 n=1 Tax=Elysia crispata TaxID=231223 RepID=A0AAE1EEZ3_9GAST|nr:hypothetical protein RRG08_040719 [Elysia crispata]